MRTGPAGTRVEQHLATGVGHRAREFGVRALALIEPVWLRAPDQPEDRDAAAGEFDQDVTDRRARASKKLVGVAPEVGEIDLVVRSRAAQLLVQTAEIVRAVDERLAGGEAPTAVIGVNDVVAVGALDALLAAGRVVPRDVSLAGFDDIPLASSRILGLTTVAQHIDVMGKRAVEVMIQRLGQPEGSPPVQEVLEPERIVRATTGAAR